jgi:hypothetical protein
MLFEREPVEQRVLLDFPLPHHRLPQPSRFCENYAIIANSPPTISVESGLFGEIPGERRVE